MNGFMRYIILLSFVFSTLVIGAQPTSSLRFSHLSVDDGLSQNSVRCILQDRKGFMWFGTEEGLNRYDGYDFHSYQNVQNDTTSLSASDIRSMIEDQEGNLWVGTTEGLNVLDRYQDSFRRVSLLTGSNKTAKKNFIFSLYEDRQGDIWVGTRNGFFWYHKSSQQFTYYGEEILEEKVEVRAFSEDAKGDILIGSNLALYKLYKTQNTIKRYLIREGESYPHDISNIIKTKDDHIWIGTFGGLFEATLLSSSGTADAEFQFTPYYFSPGDSSLHKNMIHSMTEDDQGNLWLGAFDGLFVFNTTTKAFSNFHYQKSVPGSLSADFIMSAYTDQRGDIWLGTFMGGINVYHQNNSGFEHPLKDRIGSEMKGQFISSFAETPEGNLWMATTDGGLSFMDRSTGVLTNYRHDESKENSLAINDVRDIVLDDDGKLWIATYFGGLNCFDPVSQRFQRFTSNQADPGSISRLDLNVIFKDKRGRIWIGLQGGGVDLYDKKQGHFLHFKHDPDSDNSISSNIVVDLFEDQADHLWIATRHSGVNRLDLKTLKITRFRHDRLDSNSISSDAVTHTFQDSKGRIWMGTRDAGLNLFDPETEHFTSYRKSHGLPSDAIHGMLEDDAGYLWLSTNQGLSRFSPTTEEVVNFDKSDGLNSNQFLERSCLKLQTGELLFGGVKGFTLFDPQRLNKNTFVPPIVITNFRLFNQEVAIQPQKGPLTKPIDETQTITLRNNQSVLSFDFVALNYLYPSKNQYAYRLVGLSDDWNFIGDKRTVDFTTLPPGDYTFEVKASNNSGVWNEVGTAIGLTILPPWYASWWAWLIYGVIFVLLLLAYRYYTLQRLNEKHKLHLAKMERDQIEEMHRMKLRFFTEVSHELRTPLTLILGPVEKMYEWAKKNEEMSAYLASITTNCNYLLKLITELLDFRKMEEGKMELDLQKVDILPLVKSVQKSFLPIAIKQKVDFSVTFSAKQIEAWVDIDKLQKVLYNLISNAFKFTDDQGNGKVSVQLDVKRKNQEAWVQIKVEDNGSGIPPSEQDKIFNPFYQAKTKPKEGIMGSGIGLALSKRLIELHQGEIQLCSREKQGTCFTIELPLESAVSIDRGQTAPPQQAVTTQPALSQIPEELSRKPVLSFAPPKLADTAKPHLLLVEDNTSMRHFLINCLSENYEITAAQDGDKGWQKLLAKPADIIISDVMMPTMDGIAFCQKLKNDIRTSHIPVVFLSAKAGPESQVKGLVTGADAYLTKPFSVKHLEATLTSLLDNRKKIWEAFNQGQFSIRQEQALGPIDQKFLARVSKTIDENMGDPDFSIEQFAREVAMSRSHFHRKLKKLTGLSAGELLMRARLKKAAFLLQENQLTITEVAFRIGFAAPNYFAKCFRKMYGVAPTKYRKQLIYS